MVKLKRQHQSPSRSKKILEKLLKFGSFDDALNKIRVHLTFSPNDFWYLQEGGRAARRTGDLTLAESYYRRALKIRPKDAGLLNGLGLTFYDGDKFSQAEECYKQSITLLSSYSACHNNYAILLHKTDRHTEAIEHYQLAISHNLDYTEARYGLSTVLAHFQRLTEAEEQLRLVLVNRPNDSRINTTLSMVLLRQGKMKEGWQCYKERYSCSNPERFFSLPKLNHPYWQGENLAGKTIVIHREQGLGDEIQFCRYLPLLKHYYKAEKVIYIGSASLQQLLSQMPELDLFIEYQRDIKLPACDYWSVLLDLPLHFMNSSYEYGSKIPYLMPPAPVSLRTKGSTRRIGVVWKGSTAHKNDRHRSLESLSQLMPLWQVPGTEWISLQKGAGEEEALLTNETQPIEPLGNFFNSYTETAQAIAGLDLIITVDTSVAHLAGAMGKSCWVLLPAVSTDWRWQIGLETTPWYVSMRLFQRKIDESWEMVINRVLLALKAHT